MQNSSAFQYAIPGSFFIRVRAGPKNPDAHGTCFVGIYQHTGQTPDTAIVIQPWAMPQDPGLPAGQPNGAHDECWFRAEIGQAYSGKEHNSRFFVQNNTGHEAEITAFKSGFSVHAAFSNADTESIIDCTTAGPDWLGADEITLTLYADDHRPEFFSIYWDDADSDEILKLEGQVQEIAFVSYIEIFVNESDFIQSPNDWTRIAAMGPTDGLIRERAQSFDVQSDSYQFECTLSRTQQG